LILRCSLQLLHETESPVVVQLPLAEVNAASELLCARRFPKLSYAQQKYGIQLGAGTFGVLGGGSAGFDANTSRFN
jgi:hypothetical protein